jgi:hypothetical protein
MDNETKKKIFDQYQRLPVALQQAIMSADLPTHFQEITDKYNLLLDQASALETETLLILLGFEPYSKITENLERELIIPINKANEIAREVDEQILQKVRAHLIGGQTEETIPTKKETYQVPVEKEITTLKQAMSVDAVGDKDATFELKPILEKGKISTPATTIPPKIEATKIDNFAVPNEKTFTTKIQPSVSTALPNNNNFLSAKLQNTVVTNPERVPLNTTEGIKSVNKTPNEPKKFDPYREPLI